MCYEVNHLSIVRFSRFANRVIFEPTIQKIGEKSFFGFRNMKYLEFINEYSKLHSIEEYAFCLLYGMNFEIS